jgi:hypothetical protein
VDADNAVGVSEPHAAYIFRNNTEDERYHIPPKYQ